MDPLPSRRPLPLANAARSARRPRAVLPLFGAVVVALLAWTTAGPAWAHGRSHSYSSWTVDGRDVLVRVRIPRVEVTRLGPLGLTQTTGRPVSDYLAQRLVMRSDAGDCALVGAPSPRPGDEGWSVHAWRLRCPSAEGLEIESRILLEAAPSHLHFARVEWPDGRVAERVLHESEPVWALSPATEPEDGGSGSDLLDYALLGIEHILTGWDHLAFVLGLLLLATRLREVAGLVTGFTVGHSLTLAFAVLGWIRTESAAVESVIAFSVALVAVENSWWLGGRGRAIPAVLLAALGLGAMLAAFGASAVPLVGWLGLAAFSGFHFALLGASPHPQRWRGGLAFAFGLIHGFGFAGVLAELHLPTSRLVPALLGFNVGVEVGQLGVVLVAWPLLAWLARVAEGAPRRWVGELGSAAIAGLGVFWLVTRAFGGGLVP